MKNNRTKILGILTSIAITAGTMTSLKAMEYVSATATIPYTVCLSSLFDVKFEVGGETRQQANICMTLSPLFAIGSPFTLSGLWTKDMITTKDVSHMNKLASDIVVCGLDDASYQSCVALNKLQKKAQAKGIATPADPKVNAAVVSLTVREVFERVTTSNAAENSTVVIADLVPEVSSQVGQKTGVENKPYAQFIARSVLQNSVALQAK